MIRSGHWKFWLVLFPIIGTCALANFQGPGGMRGFFATWYAQEGFVKTIPNLAIWLDFSDSNIYLDSSDSTVLNNGFVHKLKDKSGNDNDFIVTVSSGVTNRSQRIDNNLNGKTALVSTNFNIGYAITNISYSYSNYNLFIVGNITNTKNFSRYFTQTDSGIDYSSTNGFIAAYRSNGNNIQTIINGATVGNPVNYTNGLFLYHAQLLNGTSVTKTIWFTKTATQSFQTAISARGFSTTRAAFGISPLADNTASTEPFSGSYGEIIVVYNSMTQEKINDSVLYLQNKWGFQ